MQRDRSDASRWLHVVGSLPVRLGVTTVLLALLAVQIDWDDAARRVRDGDPMWMAAAVSILSVGLLVGALRWHVLLRAADVRAGSGDVLRGYYIGAFANNFLPTGFGGDAVRAVAVARRGPELAHAATSVLVDRISALACLVGLAWLTLPLDVGAVPPEVVASLAALTAGAAVASLLLLRVLRSARVRSIVPARVEPTLVEMARPLTQYARNRRLVARTVALGLLYQALVVLAVWCAAQAIELKLPFGLLACVAPLVLVLTALPVSIAGFGVREGAYAVLLGTAGVATTDGAIFSLVTVVLMATASLPGALALVRWRAAPA